MLDLCWIKITVDKKCNTKQEMARHNGITLAQLYSEFIITKVNGHDIATSSHTEAVEVLRSATEPIVVHAMRNVTGSCSAVHDEHMHSEVAMVTVATQTDDCSEEELQHMWVQQQQEFAAYDMLYNTHDFGPPFTTEDMPYVPTVDFGMTDLDYINALDLWDAGFDMEYEEVILERCSTEEKVGLTLCYENHASVEDEITDIFVSEIEPHSIAALDARIREGDQILQINETEVHSRQDAIKLFSETGADIRLLIARQIFPVDDGFVDGRHLYYDMHVDHHSSTSNNHACQNQAEEVVSMDTSSTGQTKNDKDSGVGLKNDESSEQDLAENASPGADAEHHYSNDSFTSQCTADGITTEDQLILECDRFREALEQRCGINFQDDVFKVAKSCSGPQQGLERVDSHSSSSIERDILSLNEEMKQIQIECQEIVDAHKDDPVKCVHFDAAKKDTRASPNRVVPRMGTRLDYAKQLQLQHELQEPVWIARDQLNYARTAPQLQSNKKPNIILPLGDKNVFLSKNQNDTNDTTVRTVPVNGNKNNTTVRTVPVNGNQKGSNKSACFNESCRIAPLTLELNQSDKPSLSLKPMPFNGELQNTGNENVDPKCSVSKSVSNSSVNQITQTPEPSSDTLQELYSQYADVMYTNQANLQHTIMLQQKLFQQKLSQPPCASSNSSSHTTDAASTGPPRGTRDPQAHEPTPYHQSEVTENQTSCGNGSVPLSAYSSLNHMRQGDSSGTNASNASNASNVQMEWVVKRRADGSRYITRRPMRSKMLKERARKISEERSGMTTDDDAMSELKVGRYWSKDERKRHVEKAREYKRRKQEMLRHRMDTVRENDDQKREPNILQLSQRKMMKHKGRRMFDDFTTVQEMLAHGSRNSRAQVEVPPPVGGTPLLSVTTV